MSDEKILFLDVDGVIATRRSIKARGYRADSEQGFDPIACELIQKVCDEFGYTIVISSTWGLMPPGELGRILRRAGITAEWHSDWRTPRKLSSSRPAEIGWWIDAHPEVKPMNCLVLDDMDCSSLSDRGVLVVQTCQNQGFSYENYCLIAGYNGVTPGVFLM